MIHFISNATITPCLKKSDMQMKGKEAYLFCDVAGPVSLFSTESSELLLCAQRSFFWRAAFSLAEWTFKNQNLQTLCAIAKGETDTQTYLFTPSEFGGIVALITQSTKPASIHQKKTIWETFILTSTCRKSSCHWVSLWST